MNGIQKILHDPQMGKKRFTVDRLILTRQYNHLDKDWSFFRVSGCVQEATPEEAKLTVAEYHGQKILRFFAPFDFSAGETIGSGPSYMAANRIHLDGKTYRVLKTWKSDTEGFTEAWTEEMEQEPEDD